MDATREHLFGRILLERGVVLEGDLRRYAEERDAVVRRGGQATLGQLLVREHRLDPNAFVAIQREVEARGRACFTCRRAYLVAAGGPTTCPVCAGPTALPPPAGAAARPSGSFAAAGGAGAPLPRSSGRFAPPGGLASSLATGAHPTVPAAAYSPVDVTGSGRFAPGSFTGAPASGSFAPLPGTPLRPTGGASPASGRFARPTGAVPVPGPLVPSQVSPHGATPPPGTDPGSTHGGSGSRTALGRLRQGAELGKALGPYELVKELGRGGMGVVYKARHAETGQVVALKVLIAGELASPKLLARFLEEAKLGKKLDHPGIVPVLDVGEVEGMHYFTMKFVEGDLLEGLMKEGRGLAARKGAEILREVALAAHFAHENGIVHRDLKPANVIIDRETEKPLILDFGLAKNVDESERHLSRTGVALGTPFYMPPEQAKGLHREIDARTDVYALGAILYEILTRKVPHDGETQAELLKKIIEDEPLAPSQVRPGVPRDLETIALKAMRKNKEDRYPSAEAMAEDLARATQGERIAATREAIWAPLRRKVEKSPRVVLGIALALAFAGCTLAYAVHAANENERIRLEADAQKKRDDAERARLEAEAARKKALDDRRLELEGLLASGRSKRVSARRAAAASEARGSLTEAEHALGRALALAEAGSPSALLLHYERGCARADLGARDQLAATIDDLAKASEAKTLRSRAHLRAALIFLRFEHDLVRARTELEAARTPADVDDPAARLEEQTASLLAEAYLALLEKRPEDAIKRCQEAERSATELLVDVHDALTSVYVSSAPATGASPLLRTALDTAQKGLALDHWRYTLLVNKAVAEALQGDLIHAREDVDRARSVCPEASNVHFPEALIAAREDREDDMRAAVSAAKGEQPGAAPYWDVILGRCDEILDAVRKPPAPPREPWVPRTLFSDLTFNCDPKSLPRFDEVRAFIDKSRFDDAIALLARIEKDDPQHADIALWRARLISDKNQLVEARKIIDSVLAALPGNAFALTLLGDSYARAGDGTNARKAFEAAIAAKPEARTPRYLLASMLAAARRWSDAIAVEKAALERDPDDAELWALLANALVNAGKMDEAVEAGRKSVEIAPLYLVGRNACADALHRANRHDEALQLAEEGLKLAPGTYWMLLDMAVALNYVGRYEESDRFFEQGRQAARGPKDREQLDRVAENVRRARPR